MMQVKNLTTQMNINCTLLRENLIIRKVFFFYKAKKINLSKKFKKFVIFLTISIDNMTIYGYN